MTTALEELPRGTLAALERAVQAAAEWRGTYTGDPEALAAYDAELARMRAALAAVKRQNRAVKTMTARATQVATTATLH